MATAATITQNPPLAQPDLTSIKTRQQGAWSSGDYAVVGTTLQIGGEELCEALDIRLGQRVLDVAAGNGNASLAAARRWCDVVATDYVPALLDRARERADAQRLAMEFREADAEALPFASESFHVVVSTFGVMFTPDQDRAATELLRVCERGGRLVSQTGRRRASSVSCSRRLASTFHPLQASGPQLYGEIGTGWRSYSVRVRHRSPRRNATLCSAIARRSIGWISLKPTTALS